MAGNDVQNVGQIVLVDGSAANLVQRLCHGACPPVLGSTLTETDYATRRQRKIIPCDRLPPPLGAWSAGPNAATCNKARPDPVIVLVYY